jgi:hypothetical protein
LKIAVLIQLSLSLVCQLSFLTSSPAAERRPSCVAVPYHHFKLNLWFSDLFVTLCLYLSLLFSLLLVFSTLLSLYLAISISLSLLFLSSSCSLRHSVLLSAVRFISSDLSLVTHERDQFSFADVFAHRDVQFRRCASRCEPLALHSVFVSLCSINLLIFVSWCVHPYRNLTSTHPWPPSFGTLQQVHGRHSHALAACAPPRLCHNTKL